VTVSLKTELRREVESSARALGAKRSVKEWGAGKDGCVFGNAADLCYASRNPSAFVFGVTDKTLASRQWLCQAGTSCYLVGQQQTGCGLCCAFAAWGERSGEDEKRELGSRVRDGFRQARKPFLCW
jgi:hypothetical protein